MLRFNKRTTDVFHLVLQPEISFISAKRNEEAKKIEGVDGELFIGDATFSNVEQTYSFVYTGKNIEEVKRVIENMIELDEIRSIRLNNDYNFTDTTTKEYRYQAIFEINYYEE